MINPGLMLGPSGQPGVMTPIQDALNGAYTGNYSGVDPAAGQPVTVDLSSVGYSSFGVGPTVVPSGSVSPSTIGSGAPAQIIGTPDTAGPASALSGQATAGDSGVLSAQTSVSIFSAGDPGMATISSGDPAVASATAAPASS